MYTKAEVKEAREDSVDMREEACLLALSRSAIYQQKLHHYHNQKIRPLAFREGDLVLRRIQKSDGQHKLSSPWEGPFIVSRALKNNAYYLIDLRKPTRYWILRGKKWSVLGTPSCYVRFTVEWYCLY